MARLLSFELNDANLNAFVDGELDAIHSASVAASVYADRDATARVADYRAQNAGLRALYDDIVREPLPLAMQNLIDSMLPRLQEAC